MKDLVVNVFGDVALATSTATSAGRSGGKPIAAKLESTMIFVKVDGDWKIVHEHFSPLGARHRRRLSSWLSSRRPRVDRVVLRLVGVDESDERIEDFSLRGSLTRTPELRDPTHGVRVVIVGLDGSNFQVHWALSDGSRHLSCSHWGATVGRSIFDVAGRVH